MHVSIEESYVLMMESIEHTRVLKSANYHFNKFLDDVPLSKRTGYTARIAECNRDLCVNDGAY